MQIVEGKMNECSLLMGHIRSKILATNDVPSRPKFALNLPLDYACHFTVFLCLESSLNISNFFDGRVADTNDDALFFRRHIGVPN